MENKTALALLGIVLLAIGGLACLNFFVFNQPVSAPPSVAPAVRQPTRPLAPSPTPAYPPEELEKVKREGGVIPFDYEVIAASSNEVTVIGDRGEAKLTNSPNISIFKKTAEATEPVDFSYLKVGQKLQIERAAPPEKTIKIYIVEE